MKFDALNQKSKKKSSTFILIFLVLTIFLSVSLAALTVHAVNVVQDESFEGNNNTWTNTSTNGGIAQQSNTSQHYDASASGLTSTTGSTGTSTAILYQSINYLITDFNFTNSLSWWALWQANATTGARDCYTKFTSNTSKYLYYWYNLNNGAPANDSSNAYLTLTNPTWQTWTQVQRNLWQDWNAAGFSIENITNVSAICEGNYTAGTVSLTTIRPNLPGTYADFTVYPAIGHWDAVNEVVENDSDGVYSSTASQNDTYNLEDISLPAGATINNVTVYETAMWYNSTLKNFKIMIISGGTIAYSTNKITTALFVSYNNTWATDPATGSAWTQSAINALEVGEQLTPSSGGANVTWVYVVVTYTTANIVYGEEMFWDVFNLSAGGDLTSPIASFGTNPVNNYNDTDGSITFDLKCEDDVAVSQLMLYGNWSGSWVANQTNTSPSNNTFWNVSVVGIPEGMWTWATYCNDTTNNPDWTDTNRTITVDKTAPTATFGTDPVNGSTKSSSIIIFDAKCSDNTGLQTLQIWTNKTGSWTSSGGTGSPTNDTWYNISISGWSNGYYLWAVKCIDRATNTDFTDTNRTFTVLLSGSDNSPTVTLNSPGDGTTDTDGAITFNCTGSDDLNLTNVSLYGNWSGGWHLNETNSSPINNTPTIFSKTLGNGIYLWNCRACDNASQCAFASGNYTLTINTSDTTAPTYSNNGVNTTINGSSAKFYIQYNDDAALDPNGGYIFSTNNSGSWANDSYVNWTATPDWANVTKTLNSTVGVVVGYRWYANDSAGNKNNTDIFTLTTTQIGEYTNIGSCPYTINDSGEYRVNDTLSSTGTCITVNASDVIVDCQLNTITYAGNESGYGVWVLSGKNNITINDCTIEQNISAIENSFGISLATSSNNNLSDNTITIRGTTTPTGGAVRFYQVNNTFLDGNTINFLGSSQRGVYFYGGFNNTLSRNFLTIQNAQSSDGVYLEGSRNNTIDQNNITGSAANQKGIYLYSGSNYNTIINNSIDISGSSSGRPYIIQDSNNTNSSNNDVHASDNTATLLYLQNSHNGLFNNETIISAPAGGGDGVYAQNSTNTNFTNCQISSKAYGLEIDSGNSLLNFANSSVNTSSDNFNDTHFTSGSFGQVNFTNVTFRKNRVSFNSTSTASLFVKWYVDVYVNRTDGLGAVEGANVTAYPTKNQTVMNQTFTNLTGVDGMIQRQIVTEYKQNYTSFAASWKVYNFTAHNFTASLEGFATNNTLYNVTSNALYKNITITLNTTICRTISSANTVYTIPADVSNSGYNCCINITASNVTINGAGHTIDGRDTASTSGICVNKTGTTLTNVTIENVTLTDWYYGIYSRNISNSKIRNVSSSSSILGIELDYSSNNNISNNTLQENLIDFGIGVSAFSDCNNIIQDNTGSGDRSIGYYNSSVNLTSATFSELILCNASNSNLTNITINGSNTLNNNYFQPIDTNNSNFTRIFSSSNYYGILWYGSYNNVLRDSIFNSNAYAGTELWYSDYNQLINNSATSNLDTGFVLNNNSEYNNLTNNTATSNANGGFLMRAGASYNTYLNNTAQQNGVYYGDVYINSSSNNVFTNQTIKGGYTYPAKISFTYSGDAKIFGLDSAIDNPSGFSNFGKWINITKTSGWIFLNFSYEDADLGGVNENNLEVAKHNSSWYVNASTFSSSHGVSAANNYVYANITNIGTIVTFTPLADTGSPTVNLNSPKDGAGIKNSNVSFKCTPSDNYNLKNVTLYGNFSGLFQSNQTNSSPVNNSITTFYNVLNDGNYIWNCYACDNASNCAFALSTFTFLVDTIKPIPYFVSPTPDSGNLTTNNFVYVNVSVNDTNKASAFIDWNNSLVGYWAFEEASGTTINDNSTWRNYGYEQNMSSGIDNGTSGRTTGGNYGQGMMFDGVNDSVIIYDQPSLELRENVTIDFWVKPNSDTGTQDILSKHDNGNVGYTIEWVADPLTFGFSWGNNTDFTCNGPTDGISLTADTWQHVAFVKSGATVTYYKNGVSTGSCTGNFSTIATNYNNLYLGRMSVPWQSNYNYFNGSLDEFKIYSRALSAQEINASYNNALYRIEKNFTGLSDGNYSYYGFATDKAGNTNKTETRNVIVNSANPSVTLNVPKNDSGISNTTIIFNCSASDNNGLYNATLYGNFSGNWSGNGTNNFSGVSNSTNFSRTLSEGNYIWNCYACDIYYGCSFSSNNYSLIVDTTKPQINFTSPTPSNGERVGNTQVTINVSVNDTNKASAVLDWNKTLIGYWAFEEKSGIGCYDNSSYGNTGTMYNMSSGVDNGVSGRTLYGKNGRGMMFDGVNDYIKIVNVGYNTTNGSYNSVMFWMYWNGNSNQVVMNLGSYFNYSIWIYNTTCMGFNTGHGDAYGIDPSSLANHWTHVALMFYNGDYTGRNQIFINGVNQTLTQCAGSSQNGSISSTSYLGSVVGSSYFFNGTLDEITAYNRVLSAQEINASYNNALYRLETNMTNLSDGNYSLRAWATDRAGNMNKTELRNITIDTILDVTLNHPENASSDYGLGANLVNVTFNCSATSNANLKNITLYGNWSGWGAKNVTNISGITNTSIWYNSLNETIYVYNCYACDNNSNCTFAANNYTFRVRTNPSIYFVDPTPDSGIINQRNVYVNVTTSDWNLGGAYIDWNYSLVGYWAFEETNGTTCYDNSSYGNTGTLMNNPNRSDGKFGLGIYLNNSNVTNPQNQSVNISNGYNFNLTDKFTLEAWIKTTRAETSVVIGKSSGTNESGSGFTMYISGGTNVYCRFTWDGGNQLVQYSIAEPDYYTDGNWHHIACVYDNSSSRFDVYYDGIVNRNTKNGAADTNNYPLYIGRESNIASQTRYFREGYIDEVRVWNRALSDQEINASRNNSVYRLERNFTNLSEGSYDYYAFVTDTDSNTNETETRTATIDSTPPTITIISPTNTTYNTQNVWANVSLNEAGSWCGYSLDEEGNVSLTRKNSTYFYKLMTSLEVGQHNITFYCNDTVGNMNRSAYVYFTINEAPEVIFVSPTDPDGANVERDWTYINTSIIDEDEISNCLLQWNNVNESMIIEVVDLNETFNTTLQLNDAYDLADVYAYNSTIGSPNYGFQMRWNISSIPRDKTIEQVLFCTYWVSGIGLTDTDANYSRINNQTWNESISASEWNVFGLTNTTTSEAWSNNSNMSWGCLDISNVIKTDYAIDNNFSSIRIEDSDFLIGTADSVTDNNGLVIGNSSSGYLIGEDRENTYASGKKPYLNITYSESKEVKAHCYKNKSMSEGNYIYKVYANDSNNMFGVSEEREIHFGEVISECMNFTVPNKQYTLNQSVSSNGTCFRIFADNVTLNCKNTSVTINYSIRETGDAVYSNASTSEVGGCNIVQSNASVTDAHGILLLNGTNATISDNILTVSSPNASGIYLKNENSSNLEGNLIRYTDYGVYINQSSRNNNITNNTFLGNDLEDVFIWRSTQNNSLITSVFTNTETMADNVISTNYNNLLGDLNINSTISPGSPPAGYLALEKYINISTTNLSIVTLKMHYTDDELNDSGIKESTLKIWKTYGFEWLTPSSIESYCGQDIAHPASNTIDDNLVSYWNHSVSERHNITYDFGLNYNLDAIRIRTSGVSGPMGGSVCGTEVLLSNNTVIWVSVADENFSIGGGALSGWHEIEFNYSSARYIRLLLRTTDMIGSCRDSGFLTGFQEFDARTGEWTLVGGRDNSSENYVEANLTTFSVFGAFGSEGIDGPENLSIYLREDNVTTKLNWSEVSSAEGYYIWYDDNVTRILQLDEFTEDLPNVTLIGATNTTWNDTTADGVVKRFYAVAAYRGDALGFAEDRVGKHTLTILGPSTNNSVLGFPLTYNATLSTSITPPNDFAYLASYDGSGNLIYRGWFNGQWYDENGTVADLNLTFGSGYYFNGWNSNVNITNIGIIPTGNVTQIILGPETASTMIGWESYSVEKLSELLIPLNDFAYLASYDGSGNLIYRGWFNGQWYDENGTVADLNLTFGSGYYFNNFNEEQYIYYQRNPH